MDNVREFWLENQDGDIVRFTEEDSLTFFENPQGLGFDIAYGGFRLGNAEVVNYQQYALLDIQGTLNFRGNSRAEIYQQYFDFVTFISKNVLLKLHYRTPNSFESFYRYVFVKSLNKTEIANNRYLLQCPIVFSSQTFWRSDAQNILIASDQVTGESKRYLLQRPYSYASNQLNDMKVINRGNTETALKVTINGMSVNPTLTAFDNRLIKYGQMKMLGTFDKVIVDSDDLNENIQLMQDDAWLVAPYSYQDLSIGSPNEVYVTFIKLKPGQSTLTFGSDEPFEGTVVLEWSDSYVSI